MNENERAAQIEAVAKAICNHAWDNHETMGPYEMMPSFVQEQWRETAAAALDALLPWSLDAALDRPAVAEQLGREYARQRNGEWDYDNRPSYKSHCDGNAVAEVESALITIRDAVAKAKGESNE